MIYAIDIIITRYHSHTISHILWYLSPCHGTCAAGRRWLRAPGARCSTGSSHAIANMLGTCVQLNSDCLDAVHGLVALAAARVMHCCRFVVIKKSRLAAAAAAAGCAAHAGKAEARFKHLTRMTFGPQVWTWSSRWIHVGNCQCLSEGGGWGLWVLVQPPVLENLNSESERIAEPRSLARRRPPPQTYNEGYLQRPLVRCWKVYI